MGNGYLSRMERENMDAFSLMTILSCINVYFINCKVVLLI